MKLRLVKCEGMDDWYSIERAEPDGRERVEQTEPNCLSSMCSCRVSDADVEGTREEMLLIADAIWRRKHVGFKRCAVGFKGEEVHLWSPRNSTRNGVVSLDDAYDIADQIQEALT